MDISKALLEWRLAHGCKRGLFGNLKPVNGWKWPTKRELRNALGADGDDFESALESAVDSGAVVVRNGRVGLADQQGRYSCLGKEIMGEGSF